MENSLFFRPLLAGLSVGAYCLTFCFPFMGTLIAAEDRPLRANLRVTLEFLLGRLLGYLCFGALAGYLGERFDSRFLRLATDISFILLSTVLFLYLIGLVRDKGPLCRIAGSLKGTSPYFMGFFMGINLCPPFLLAVLDVMAQKNVFYGMAYFLLFFLASSVYFLPLLFAGGFARAKEFRSVARVSGFLVSVIFFVYGIWSLLHN